jgi:hypothetical protein
MPAAAAILVIEGFMAVEDRRGIAVARLQRPQPLLIFQSPGAI